MKPFKEFRIRYFFYKVKLSIYWAQYYILCKERKIYSSSESYVDYDVIYKKN